MIHYMQAFWLVAFLYLVTSEQYQQSNGGERTADWWIDERDCPQVDGSFLDTVEASLPWGIPDRAQRTLPQSLSIVRLENGEGVVSNTFIKRFTWLGEFEGAIFHDRAEIVTSFSWKVTEGGEFWHYVDASDERLSNWLRYIDSPRGARKANVMAVPCMGHIYYLTSEDICPGQELLVDWGSDIFTGIGENNHTPSSIEHKLHPVMKNQLTDPDMTYIEDVDPDWWIDERNCPHLDRNLFSQTHAIIPWGIPDRARLTLPKSLIIATSKIPLAGHGVLANTFIQRFTWLDHFEGTILPPKWGNFSDYAFLVTEANYTRYHIDAFDPDSSNWLRYVNCARNKKEENIEPLLCMGRIYYVTIRDVHPGEELLLYYGHIYADYLGIQRWKQTCFQSGNI